MPARRLTPEQCEQIAALRETGMSYGRIARKFGCSESTVYWKCLALGAEPPSPQPLTARALGPAVAIRNGREIRRFTAEDDAKLLAMEAEGKRIADMARALGRQSNSVRARLMTLARHEARAEAA
ncbi:helix-turn-helix domain-containing protein [Methylobacterium symbioticum]|uniref:Transposase IS30-like HTH domain-containing protein n=1 Tax=Methylobacterium symbioticum TaxID=2584084 RepID=A0A509EE10_9HYPH|nr:helix-turn-helix domain-containing protein [Methylobacterium symbioticum]VUD71814.1 hypothetical protein MET9862_02402 [Methylobacterium symbioticum]